MSQLLQLIVPEKQAYLLSDFLLAQENLPFFTAIDTDGYGQPHEQLSANEQVKGAQHKVKFEVELKDEQLAPILETIEKNLPSLTIAYRVLPILQRGNLGQ